MPATVAKDIYETAEAAHQRALEALGGAAEPVPETLWRRPRKAWTQGLRPPEDLLAASYQVDPYRNELSLADEASLRSSLHAVFASRLPAADTALWGTLALFGPNGFDRARARRVANRLWASASLPAPVLDAEATRAFWERLLLADPEKDGVVEAAAIAASAMLPPWPDLT